MERKIEATGSVEVYFTEKEQICLKQEDPRGEDQYIIFPPQHADKIAKWILEVKEEIEQLDKSEAD